MTGSPNEVTCQRCRRRLAVKQREIKCLCVGGPADGRAWETTSRVFEIIETPPINFALITELSLPDETDATYKRHCYVVMEIFPHPPLKALIALPAMLSSAGVPKDWHPVWMRCFHAGAMVPMGRDC